MNYIKDNYTIIMLILALVATFLYLYAKDVNKWK
jgi:hypothetical protein